MPTVAAPASRTPPSRPPGPMAVRRAMALAAGLAMLAAAPPPVHATAKPPKCSGRDILVEMQREEPEVHARIMAAAGATENTQAEFWRIEKPGSAPSWLLGTVHVTDPRVTTLSPAVKTALAAAKSVVLEVADLSPGAMAGAITRSAPLVLYSDGRRLDADLSPAEVTVVKERIASAGMPAELAGALKPWIVYMILSVSDCERRQVQAGNLVLDMRIAEEGRRRGLPLSGLETIDEQLSAMASVPEDQQLQVLKATLKYASRINDLMETVLQLYLRRQMGAAWPLQLALAAKAGVEGTPLATFRQQLIVRRNQHMRDRLLPKLVEGGVFTAVGAMHLVGREGLVALLREAGYTVTPIE